MRFRLSRKREKQQTFGRQSLIESLESRRLQSATITSTTSNYITDILGTDVALIQVGDNGAIGGAPGTAITAGGTETNAADVEWCSDESNGFDSGCQMVQFSLNVGSTGTASLSAEDAPTISSSSMGSNFSQVTISAAVAGWGMAMHWDGIVVDFYNGNTLLESDQIAPVGVDTTNADTNDPQQSITTISTNLTNCTSVVVSASVQMYSVQGVYPGATDIAGAIAVS